MRGRGFLLLAVGVAVVAYACGDEGTNVVPEPVNQAPLPVGAIPSQEVPATDTVMVELAGYFNDPDGDRLVYSATTSNAAVMAASVSASTLVMVATGKGLASVTVTARDPGGLTATQIVDITVVGKPGFLRIVVQHPGQDVGAIVVHVDGPSIDSVGTVPDMVGYHVPVRSGFRAFVAAASPTGNIGAGGAILRFWSEDVSELASYTANLEQVAATTYEQLSVDAARATVVH